MCYSACRIRLFGVYKANRLLLTNQAKLTTINTELKKNEVNYYVKLNEALKENDHLKQTLFERNVEVNMLIERVTLAEFETSKLKTKLDKWTISGMKQEELFSKQRVARIKSGVAYGETPYVYPPPSTFCYSPISKPHPRNDLIEKETNSLHAGLERVKLKEVRDDYDSSTGMGYYKTGTGSQANDCSVPVVSKPVMVVTSNFFDKFKAGEIPSFEHVRIMNEEIDQESSNHQAATTSTHSIPINQDPLEAEVLIENWRSSDDVSKTNESLGDSKINISSETVKTQKLPKLESRQFRISFPAIKQASCSSKAQKKKPSPLSIIYQVCKRLENKQVKISSPIQQSKTNIRQSPTTQQKKPQICSSFTAQQKKQQVSQQLETSSKKALPPAAPHVPVKLQKTFKACFKCGNGDHVLKKCPKGHASDGKGKTNCFSGSESMRNALDGKGK